MPTLPPPLPPADSATTRMQLRSGRLLAPPPPQQQPSRRGASRRPRCPEDRISALPDDVLVDRINALPDDVLLLILVRLRCAREAARTGILSSRWRDLWTLLPELSFSGVHVDSVEAALARVTRPDLLVVDIRLEDDHQLKTEQLASLVWAAAHLAPGNLVVTLSNHFHHYLDGEVLSCLHRTTSLQLSELNLVTKPPLSGEFTALERLFLHSCKVDFGTLIPMCPRLRILNATDYWVGQDLTVHSSSLEELTVQNLQPEPYFEVIDIEAPVLKKVAVVHTKFSLIVIKVSLSIPMVEDFWWCVDYEQQYRIIQFEVAIGEIWCLRSIGFGWGPLPGDQTMKLDICSRDLEWSDLAPDAPDITQAIAQLPVPVTNLTVLVLHILAEGHAIGPLVLQLLQLQPSIQRLKMVMMSGESEVNDETTSCPLWNTSCPCGKPESWRSDDIFLMGLEVVEIDGFDGKDHELDLLALIFRCAPKLKTVSVTFSEDAPSEKMNEIYNISIAYPSVQCSVNVKEYASQDE